jgi:hypothetical protein
MKKHFFSITIILFSAINYCSAQVTFQKSIGGALPDWGNSVKQTTDGGYIIAGTTMSGSIVDYQAYLIKTNASGDLLWTKTFHSRDIGGQDLRQTVDGGYILLGTGVVYQEAYLFKTDAAGDTLWTRSFNGLVNAARGYSVQQTVDSGYIIALQLDLHNISQDSANALLVKTNKNGDIIWAKSYGGPKYDIVYSVQQTNDNGFIIAGNTRRHSADSADVYLVKTNANGDTLWTRTFGGNGNDYGYDIKQTGDNGYIIVGSTNSFGAGGNDIFVVKTNSNGNILWSKTYGGAGSDIGQTIQLTADGGYVISGYTNSFGANHGYLLKVDSNGNVEWSKTIGIESANSVEQTGDGGYIFTGAIFSETGDENVLLVKTDQMGNSGCNETDAATITNTITTTMASITTMVESRSYTNSTVLYTVGSGVGFDTALCTTVGLNEIKTDNSLHISPNPSSGNFVITFPGIINQGKVEICTVFGERIFSQAVTHLSTFEINLKNSSPGIYFVNVMNGEKRYTQKIIIVQ